MLNMDEMENDINRNDSLNSIPLLDEDDDLYLVPQSYKDSVNESQLVECDFPSPRGSPALTNKEKSFNEYFSTGSIFLSDDEDDEADSVNNESKSQPSQPCFFLEDQHKIASLMFHEEEGAKSNTVKNKAENTKVEEREENIDVTAFLPGRSKNQNKRCTKAFNFAKEVISSKYREFRSAVSSFTKRDSDSSNVLVSTFCVPDGCANVSSITRYGNGHCWVAADRSESILLYDREGNLVDVVNVGCLVDSLTTDKYGNVYLSCPDVKQVRVVDRNRHVRTFLHMTKYPRGIAYMELSESIIVCSNNKRDASDMAMSSSNSVKKYGIYQPNTRKEVGATFGYPIQVCVNVNNDCVISDFFRCSITAINFNGETRFSFKSSKDFPILNRHSICCDTNGNIYIFSNGTPNVCILDSNGNLKDMLSFPDLHNEIVFAAVFDTDGYLWLGCLDGCIKIFELIPSK